MSPAPRIVCALGAALAVAGCGEGSKSELVPAAEPARSPVPTEPAQGRVTPLGNKPEGMVADGESRLLAIGITNPDKLVLVNMDSGREVKRIDLPEAPRHLQLARPGGPVLVGAEKSNELVEVSLPSGRKRVTRVGRQPHDAAGAGERVFVGNEGGDSVSVVENGQEVRRLEAPVQPGGVAVSTDGDLLAAVGVSERALELFGTTGLRSRGKIDVGIGPTHVVARGRRFFVVDTRGDALLEVRTGNGPLRVHRRSSVRGAPYGITFDRPRKRFWVTLTKTNEVLEMTDRRILRRFPTVRQPNTVAVDPRTGKVFVASRYDGSLQTFRPRPFPPPG